MKKILCLVLLVGFAYSATGNDFLNDYPFGKRVEEMTPVEKIHSTYYLGVLHGVQGGSEKMLIYYKDSGYITVEEVLIGYISLRTCNMDEDQIMRIIKKWCDDNPAQTHLDFEEIIIKTIISMSVDKSCL